MGLAESELGNYSRALKAYGRYLEEGAEQDTPERVQEVRTEIARLETLVGRVFVHCYVEGAKVKLDNESRGVTPLGGPIFADVGQHELVVKRGGDELLREVFRIAGDQELSFRVAARQEPQPGAEAFGEDPPLDRDFNVASVLTGIRGAVEFEGFTYDAELDVSSF